jgi:hypothetical protein
MKSIDFVEEVVKADVHSFPLQTTLLFHGRQETID